VDVTPTTSIPTYISFDTKGTDCLIVDKDDNIKKINFDDVKILSKDNIGDFPVSMLFKYLVITNNNRNLLHKTILDTPGYNSTDEVDMAATSSVISDSDAVFWIIDINDGTISADSIRFIKETIQQKPLYIIINKVDMKSPRDREMIKENVIRMLKKESINFIDCLLYSSRSNEYRDKISSLISGLVRDTQKGFKQILFEVIDEATNNISEQLKDLINQKKDIEKKRENIQEDHKNNIDQIYSKLSNYIRRNTRRDFMNDVVIDNPDAFIKYLFESLGKLEEISLSSSHKYCSEGVVLYQIENSINMLEEHKKKIISLRNDLVYLKD
jgi:GTPase Era involved in 16S rRNA processing